MRQDVLSAKLDELNQALIRLEDRARRAQAADTGWLRGEIEELRAECAAGKRRLARCAELGRLDELRELAQWELRLCACVEEGLPEAQDAEMAILRAEFAIDAAIQAAGWAHLTALAAIEQTRREEEEERR